MRIHWALGLILAFASPIKAQQTIRAPFVPFGVLDAKTIAVAVYWPNAGWKEKAEVQSDGENFLRKWHRYEVVQLSESPDLIALVTVEPVRRSGGFWRMLAYSLAVGAQAYARSAQNYEHCQGQINGDQINATCYGYNPTPAAAPPPPPPNYVIGGSILVFDGKFLRADGPIPEPLLFAAADNHGSKPLIGAAKRLQQMIEQAEKVLPDRMAIVDALLAKIHELALTDGLQQSEEPGCADKISTRIGADKNMLARLAHLDLQDVGVLFGELCKKVAVE
jgi:hypothetical protein